MRTEEKLGAMGGAGETEGAVVGGRGSKGGGTMTGTIGVAARGEMGPNGWRRAGLEAVGLEAVE